MNMVLKKAFRLTSALSLLGALALAAAPVQALAQHHGQNVDARMKALEQELAQLKQLAQARQEQERALAAEMKAPSFKYVAGKGLTIAAADDNWSINFGQRLQVYSSIYMTNDDPDMGYRNFTFRIRRFRPNINVQSRQGFYEVKWTFSGNTDVAFDGDAYLHFEKMNPWLPTFGYGYNPSFDANSGNKAHRTEDSLMIEALKMGGAQDGSVVLSWKKLPMMGISKVKHLEFAWGLDQQDEYGRTPPGVGKGNSVSFAFGVQPLAGMKDMGGIDVSSITYNLGFEKMSDLIHGPGRVYGPTTQERITLVDAGTVMGDHTYWFHGLEWEPMKWLGLNVHMATYEAKMDGAAATAIKAKEIRLAANVRLWGPKSGMMGGSKSEGGISISPLYTVVDFGRLASAPADAEATNHGLAIVFEVPGGWMQVHGVWDRLGCEGSMGCVESIATADEGKDNTNVFTFIVEYRF